MMKIAYISIQDSTNIRSYSGTGYFIPRALQANGAEIHYIGQLKTQPYIPEKFNELYYRHLLGKIYWMNRQPRVIKNYGKQASEKLKKIDHDVILSFSGPSLALLKTDKPLILWPDAVFGDVIDFYPEFTNMARVTIRNGNRMEKRVLERCSHIVYSSEWAAQGAIRHYNIPPEKISVIPYGANIEANWDLNTVGEKIRLKDSNVCKLLFVGIDWYRKGGSKAVRIAQNLNSRGLKTELHILGTWPENSENIPDYVKVHGFVSKETEKGKKLIHDLIGSAHFLLLPTRADCTPIVFAEFNSYGIPCLTSNVGGIPTLIKDDVNGKLFDVEAQPLEYADYILSLFSNYPQYKTLARSARQEYQKRLNWDTSGKKMMEVLNKVVKNHSS